MIKYILTKKQTNNQIYRKIYIYKNRNCIIKSIRWNDENNVKCVTKSIKNFDESDWTFEDDRKRCFWLKWGKPKR